jgi:nicotinate-nucleotide adenylyltransferase
MKIGLFGGSFDPIHRGHIEPVQEARRALGIERVYYLPTAVPPHKPQGNLASPLARFTQVELALLREEGLFASAHELTPERRAFTAETLEHFRRELPGADLHLFLGADSFLDLPHWHRFRDILSSARLVVLVRPGWPFDRAALPPKLAEIPADRLFFPELQEVGVSSTRVRELFARAEPIPSGWLPEPVLHYIAKYRLYR